MVVLHKGQGDAALLVFLSVEGLEEKPPDVAAHYRLYKDHFRQAGLNEPDAAPDALATAPGVTRAAKAAALSDRPEVTPEVPVLVTVAVCPTSFRSTSVKLTVILDAIGLVSVVSLIFVSEITATTDASLAPVTVTVTDAVAVPPLPSEAV